MKKIISLLIIIFLASGTWIGAQAQGPYCGRTKHKTVRRMTNQQVKKVQRGKNMYIRVRGQVKKNL